MTPGRGAGERTKRSYKKRPLTNPAHVEALLDAAKGLSNEHWEVVVLLYRTGIEVEALRKLTWRDYLEGRLEWKRPKRKETLRIPLNDPELLAAVRGYTQRPRRSSDRIDRLVKDAKEATGLAELADVSPMTLRLTRGWLMLQEGRTVESVARQLAIAPALVAELSEIKAGPAEGVPPAAQDSRRG